MPSTMSCVGVASGEPCAGLRMLFEDSIRIRASACASALKGTWTAIWSPSKSALKAWQTRGWIWMALPSTSTGSNAWMPRRWSVGARLRRTGCSWMTSSSTSQTSGIIESTIFLAALMFWAALRSTRRAMMNGLNSSSAISLGRPHWWSLSAGPATMTGRAEVQQPLEAVVAVDDAPVEVVEVRGGEAAAVELDHRAQLRRDHRHGLEDHHVRRVDRLAGVVGLQEGRHDLQALDRALLLLTLGGLDLLLEVLALGLQVDLLEQVAHGLGAHAAAEVLAPPVR